MPLSPQVCGNRYNFLRNISTCHPQKSGLYNFSGVVERYSHEGYLMKVVIMALAGEVARELSPIWSWSNNNYEI